MSESRLSSLDASFLEVESPSAHMHVGWAAKFAPRPEFERPGFDQLRDHVAARIGRAPRYRQKLGRVPLGLGAPVWLDDEDFDVDRHVHRLTCSDFAAATDQVMSSPLPGDLPLWELWIADRLSDGRIGVIGKAHHAMVDGVAAVELSTLLVDPTPHTPDPDRDQWVPASEPGGARLLVDAALDRIGDAWRVASWPLALARRPTRVPDLVAEGVRAGRAIADSARPATSGCELNKPISPRRRLARVHRPLADLKRVKESFGATINDVVLASAAGGIRRFFESRGEPPAPLKAMVPVSSRADREGGELGNRISFVFVDLPCDRSNPTARLSAVKEAIGQRKRSGQPEGAERVLAAFGHAPRTLQKALARLVASPRVFNLVVSNIPGPRQPLYMLGCELEEVYPVVPIADRHALSIGMTTINDEAFFGVYADRELLPDADVLAGCLDESIEELVGIASES
jgi:diacylglycerol O-acyltransferase / wax synthase